jgi:hypothetical protein
VVGGSSAKGFRIVLPGEDAAAGEGEGRGGVDGGEDQEDDGTGPAGSLREAPEE